MDSTEGKTGNSDLRGDLYVVNDHHVSIIDGTTNISGRLIDNKAPGRLAAEVVQEAIMEAPKDITLKRLISNINKKCKPSIGSLIS